MHSYKFRRSSSPYGRTRRELDRAVRKICDKDLQNELRCLVPAYENHLAKLRSAWRLNDRPQFEECIETFLEAPQFRCLAALIALQRKEQSVSTESLLALMPKADPRLEIGEPIVHKFLKKMTGRYRSIYMFGTARTAQQTLTLHMLQTMTSPSQWDGSLKRGRDRLVSDLVRNANLNGWEYFVVADIKDCFGSMDHELVTKELPLPKSIIENTVMFPKGATTIPYYPGETGSEESQKGLPQGSRVSPIVCAVLLVPRLTASDQLRGSMSVYVDDIAIGAGSYSEAKAHKSALETIITTFPSGPLTLKTCDIKSASKGFEYLGYWIRRSLDNGLIEAVPTINWYEKLARKIAEHFSIQGPDIEVDLLANDEFLIGWLKQVAPGSFGSVGCFEPGEYDLNRLACLVYNASEAVRFGRQSYGDAFSTKHLSFNFFEGGF